MSLRSRSLLYKIRSAYLGPYEEGADKEDIPEEGKWSEGVGAIPKPCDETDDN